MFVCTSALYQDIKQHRKLRVFLLAAKSSYFETTTTNVQREGGQKKKHILGASLESGKGGGYEGEWHVAGAWRRVGGCVGIYHLKAIDL